MLSGKYLELHKLLLEKIPSERMFSDDLRTLAYGTDASFYRLIPKLVVKVESEEEVILLLKHCRRLNISVTFRAAGTSLSGQSISDSVLVVLGSKWKKFHINHDASEIRLQVGIVGAHANVFLAPYKRKIGPDPGSINSAMIGGIAANNASGMCCGTSQNSYRTLAGMKIIFQDGSLLDTNDPESRKSFSETHTQMISEVCALSKKVKGNEELSERIKRKFKMKNTTGYSLNALVDFDDPIEIIQHLMIGSEGTLGFISEVNYYTVPEFSNKATSLMLFPDAVSACKAVEILKTHKVSAVELMDRAALRSVEDKEGMPSYLKTLAPEVASILVDTRAEDQQSLLQQISEITDALKDLPKVMPIEFTQDEIEFKRLWDIRNGLFPSVGAMRKIGTSVIIEDVCFPIKRLAEATGDLQELFKKHGYYDAIIFGHALEGNLHFVFKQDFATEAEINRYKNFIDDVTNMVVKKYDGSLKAEHGTGRNMAPFVELEWGKEAFRLMQEIKHIFDPDNIINPGVILNDDSHAHIKNLKPLPAANSIVDKCIECGFCEVNCPSAALSITPRQRIVVWREIARLRETGQDPARLSNLISQFDYDGNQTCATDGLCATSCPVGINTGNLIKELRCENASPTANGIADMLSSSMGGLTSGMKLGLNIVHGLHSILGTTFMQGASDILRKASGNRIPMWNRYMPKGADRIQPQKPNGMALKVVYFPSCINRTMGLSKESEEKESLTTKMVSLLNKAGYEVIYPKNLSSLCCGMAFASKGFKRQGDKKSNELLEALLVASENGNLPVLFDMSPCLYRMKEYLSQQKDAQPLKIYEPVEFIDEFLASRLKFTKINEKVAIHSTCSSTKMGLSAKLKKVAELCAEEVIVPHGVGCCGWAGDRGFTYPELNASALRYLKEAIPEDCHHGYSTSRTCEIGLSVHSGINYESIIYLVDKCSEPLEPEIKKA
ncbi:MAG: FAD-binding oxidoreductase [Ignavibacteria bacterium]|nr:FAD-binding oxidoreductase [Ignavibacteria bacterium]MCU7503598.1 FAD-binding oxidoreductase [Ignavibacteria bacterium]MCU7516748.1 FAD-binding oxidoreductase [Ignavibacteria bacterium]